MKKRLIIIFTSVLLLSLVWVGSVYAQDEVPPEPTEEPEETPLDINPVCLFTREHSVLAGLAERYNVAYEDLVALFCESDLGVGEIALALAIVQQSEGAVTIEDLVTQRLDDELGWGEIWQELGYTGQSNGIGLGLFKNENRNKFQEEVQNEGEDDQLQVDAEHEVNFGQGQETAPGQADKEDKETGKPVTPPGQDGSRGNGKP
ncbi:MAG: hypothetical protein H0S79_06750 [Anaerolineaceae bacterium]|nr:hypothetical protein [Anaerolineaceae bacterium]